MTLDVKQQGVIVLLCADVMSIKSGEYGRSRDYSEGNTLEEAAAASKGAGRVYWASTDAHDHPCQPGGTGAHAEVYELMSNAYESGE